jgi:hypothetical protein
MRRGAVLSLVAVAVAACAQATGEVRGGETLETAPPPPPSSICFDEDAGGGGTRWTDLHRDLFGPMAFSRCAGRGECHGAPEQLGARASDIVCGADASACRASFIETDLRWVVPGAPDDSRILKALRRQNVDGGIDDGFRMPRIPSCAFSVASMERIRTWIQNGAPDD